MASRRHQDQLMRRRQDQEQFRQGLQTMLRDTSLSVGHAESHERARKARLQRQFDDEAYSAQMEEQMEASIRMEERRRKQAEIDAKLAEEVEARNLERLREEKLIQRVREQSEELRDLRSKLNLAAVSKQRVDQMAEMEAQRRADREREMALDRDMEAERQRKVDEARAKEASRAQDMQRVRVDLDRQLGEEREAQQRAAYEEFVRDKSMVDSVVARLDAEEEAARVEKHRRRQREQAFAREHMDALTQRRMDERRKEEEEEQKILAYQQAKMEREAEEDRRARELRAEKERVLAKQAAELQRKADDREEMLQLVADLYTEEREAKEREEAVARAERERRQRAEMLEANEYQKRLKEERAAAQREEEERFRQAMMDRFAEEDRLEQLAQEKRRRKMIEHRRAVEGMIEDRRSKLEEEKRRERMEREEEERMKEIEKRIVEQERRRMLREHVASLVGHLPRGVLLSEGDLEALPEDARADIQTAIAERRRKEAEDALC